MDLELKGKHVLITGGTRGIGLACARLFLREGARVSICGRSAASRDAALAALAGLGSIRAYLADVEQAAAAAAMVEQVEAEQGPIDVLVNSAGAAARHHFADLDPAAWQAAMNAKFQTYVNVTDPLIKRMAARGSGVVVNVIGAGGKVPRTTHLAGGAANAALMLATAGLAVAYGPQGIRVNAVNPTQTLTDRLKQGMVVEARAQGITEEEAMRRSAAGVPLRRIATPEEVADAVVYLSSARASYISGVILAIDGAGDAMVI
ncbi:MAG: dehydrogenase with different specificity (related to short-chain alcohol dehydrogenase)-like [Ramlibacter sp.]|nr:dehydrogenase with different specificity (related to short-chain alcohol dehydrogenase)-like [Ramlibacter sp.]